MLNHVTMIYSVLCVELFAKVNYTPGNWGEAGGGDFVEGGGPVEKVRWVGRL